MVEGVQNLCVFPNVSNKCGIDWIFSLQPLIAKLGSAHQSFVKHSRILIWTV